LWPLVHVLDCNDDWLILVAANLALYRSIVSVRGILMPAILAIHGGAGTMRRETMTPDAEAAFHAGLRRALLSGHLVLKGGGSALDAVTQAVVALEDDPLFNAGHGAVYTSAGKHELDAAVMNGAAREAGAVAGVLGPRNPILAARAVLASEHVMLHGRGAEDFCRDAGVAFAPAAHFHTNRRWEALLAEVQRRRETAADTRDDAAKHGTVGAVACDADGHVAAATSTGGMTGKAPGRIGDCPVFGAGTWADDSSCAVSATGHGEWFIRYGAAHEISCRMRYLGESVEQAAEIVVSGLGAIGGSGGLIAVDALGNVTLPFNSAGMYRGVIGADGVARTAIYEEALREG
jgi:isoaspartyl peptidase/L-asparaginase-like protein (Ntn-hydrolase superfamily)